MMGRTGQGQIYSPVLARPARNRARSGRIPLEVAREGKVRVSAAGVVGTRGQSRQPTGGQTLRMVPITLLRPDPRQARKQASGDLELLVASMLAFGQQTPLVIRPDPEREGHFLVMAGT